MKVAFIGVGRMGLGPSGHFGQQGLALCAVRLGLGFGLFKPGLNKRIGFVARLVKAFPQGVVGLTALIGLFPSFAQFTQGFLQFAPGDNRGPHGLGHSLVRGS